MTDKDYLQRAIKWARKKGFSDIKADYGDFEKPTEYSKMNSEQSYSPSITGKRTGRKFYIEVATKTENIRRVVSKWKLLSKLAAMKGGKLFLLAPKGHKAFVKRLLNKHQLNAQLIYMPKI